MLFRSSAIKSFLAPESITFSPQSQLNSYPEMKSPKKAKCSHDFSGALQNPNVSSSTGKASPNSISPITMAEEAGLITPPPES